MNEMILQRELNRVGLRHQRLRRSTRLALLWGILALVGALALSWAWQTQVAVPGIVLVMMIGLSAILVPIILRIARTGGDAVDLARRIETRFPDLDARLLSALEQKPEEATNQYGFLQSVVIEEAIDHGRHHDWEQIVPVAQLRAARLAQWAMLAVFGTVLTGLIVDMQKRPDPASWLLGGIASGHRFDLKIEPEDTSIERGTSLLVMARFGDKLPGEVELLYRGADGELREMPMGKSLDDPLFAARVPSVGADMTYAVKYGDEQTRWYKVGVFDYPALRQADADLRFPRYTKMPDKKVEDVRSVSAVEGTKATLTFKLNKPVKGARLVPSRAPKQGEAPATPVDLSVDADNPSVYTAAFDLVKSQSYRLQLVDQDGRANKTQPELAINVIPNRPPELKPEFPGRDVDVSPLQEMTVKAKVWDDFGIQRVGVNYSIAGQEPQDIVLTEQIAARERKDVAQLISMEKLDAEPDQLLSYHFWVEDFGPDGGVRRTAGDMYFAEVRPFEEIFRQGEQPPGGEQQQQQQQQQGQNAQQAEELAELQKQIIAATWKVMRREVSAAPTEQFVPDVKLIAESQGSAKEQAAELQENLEDERSLAHLRNVLKHMDEAIKQLNDASGGPKIAGLGAALSAEQAAYQELLKLRAREHQVVRQQRQQRGQQQRNQSSAQNRRQRQLNQLELAEQDNRYETQRSAPQQQEDPGQRETRQVLNRLRELAQRQEDLNRQMRELQSQLEQAREEAQKEELQRQLARLREQQQEMLHDTDELRDRMDQPENQQRMADSREQLEQTRENIRRASEALERGMMPEASSAGARAEEQLNNLREDVRRQASGQFAQSMEQMRQEARELDADQQELSREMNELDRNGQQRQPQDQPKTLRDANPRQEIAQDLAQQKQELDKLVENMKRTVEEAESSEPLLSRRLYEAVRDTAQQRTDEALDATRQLIERGFVEQAQQVEREAGKGITRLREGVEQAAESVLGDEAEGLRRARAELEALARQLEREMGRNGAASGEATTRPAGGNQQVAMNDEQRPGEGGEQSGREREPGNRESEQQGEGQQPQAQSGRQPGDRGQQGEQQGQQQGQRAQQPGQQGEQGQEGQPSQQGQQGQQGQGQQGQQGREGQQGQQGQRQQGQQQGEQGQQQGEQQGQQGQGGRGQNRAQQQGQQDANDRQGGQREGGLRRGGENPGDGDLRRLADGGRSGPGGPEEGPFTGDNFRDWADRLRDVEEMVGDPRLRAEAAAIRERARAIRAELNRHSKEPNWDLVRDFVSRPLVELRDKVAEELLRKQSKEALVPIDREPVPPEYAEQVRRYYERLGSGR